jgi:hypothetical protein
MRRDAVGSIRVRTLRRDCATKSLVFADGFDFASFGRFKMRALSALTKREASLTFLVEHEFTLTFAS